MKTQRTYLLILALEIAAITVLHSTKNDGLPDGKNALPNNPATITSLQPHFSLIGFN
ncbi:MAG: hypothetical protein P0Y53_23255 [Candidatus Pseudobacter hemicellulosilyticus]|uniref:Uncharacterized protein n=1 Tax=Candidatus Pseudobacter hemicellulosilyticus TaxID=3121375 RepID=A0AAJ6BHP7_9BACT|nr:MAG: hypothetical protein P0Y53_23255 [Pseudobacter sp.]